MGQTTRPQGISFTHDMWAQIEARCRSLKFGRSQYFQMLVEYDLRFKPDIHAHKSDGKWHLYPEHEASAHGSKELRAAEDPDPAPPRPKARKTRK